MREPLSKESDTMKESPNLDYEVRKNISETMAVKLRSEI